MKTLRASIVLTAAIATSGIAAAQSSQVDQNINYLTGDTRLACEAILCLSSGQRPSECTPSLKKYFSLYKKGRRDKSTAQKRSEFLNLCPAASQDANMVALVNAIVHGAGNCDAKTLNATLTRRYRESRDDDYKVYILNQYPAHCARYTGHSYTDLGARPKYVGTPDRGGFWVEASEYDARKAEYDKRIAEEDRAKAEAERKNGNFNNGSYKSSSAWGRWSQ